MDEGSVLIFAPGEGRSAGKEHIKIYQQGWPPKRRNSTYQSRNHHKNHYESSYPTHHQPRSLRQVCRISLKRNPEFLSPAHSSSAQGIPSTLIPSDQKLLFGQINPSHPCLGGESRWISRHQSGLVFGISGSVSLVNRLFLPWSFFVS